MPRSKSAGEGVSISTNVTPACRNASTLCSTSVIDMVSSSGARMTNSFSSSPPNWVIGGAVPASLTGLFLTDEIGAPTKWGLPPIEVPGGGYVVVFASGKDRSAPGAEPHANFSLSSAGEYLALVTIIDRVYDAASGTFGMRLELPNPDNTMPAGLRCTIDFAARNRRATES